MAKYIYRPLAAHHDIRLLKLEPGSRKMPLHGTLFHANLDIDPPPSYQAISYVWGCDATPFLLYTPEGTLAISSSLRSALRDLRHETNTLVLWADGVCIKQDDKDEKNHQVRLMTHIYSSATSVFAYLGEEAENSNLALDTMLKIGTAFQWDNPKRDLPPTMALARWQEGGLPTSGSEELRAVAAICQRPWFQRIWIIQELLQAREVQVVCGRGRLNWDIFFGAVWHCFYGVKIRERHLHYVLRLGVTRTCQLPSKPLDLFNLLIVFNFSKTTLTQDRFYALLPIASDGDNKRFEIDYRCPLESVIWKYNRSFIANGHLKTLLQFAGMEAQYSHLPSWIPNWSISDRAPTLTAINEQFKAGANTKLQFDMSSNPNILFLKGFLIDSVSSLGTRFDDSSIATEEYFQELEWITSTLAKYSSPNELLFRVPVGDLKKHHENAIGVYPSNLTLYDSYVALRKLLRQAHPNQDRSLDIQKLEEAAEPFRATARHFHGVNGARRRFCITRRGYLGVVSQIAEVGDVLCILSGMQVPFLLRENTERAGAYCVVGEVYIHGLMYGEAFEDGVTCKIDGQQIYPELIELH
jgi:Heterokaryon incompatibility protein (HET)